MPKARVLIVEDELLTAESIKTLLKRIDYEPIGIITSGEEVLLRIKELKPDIILMDIVLGGKIDGIKTSIQIKENFGTPVIFLTAYGDLKTINRAKMAEPSGYILKPITDEKELLPSLEIALYNNKIKKVEDALTESQAILLALLHNSPDNIIITDNLGTIHYINHNFSNSNWDNIHEKKFDELLQPKYNNIIRNGISQVFKSGNALKAEIMIPDSALEQRVFDVIIAPIKKNWSVFCALLIFTEKMTGI